MKCQFLLFFLALIVSLSGCVISLPHYTYTRNPINETVGTIIPVYIDTSFSARDQVSIDNALNDWNYALNNYIRFQVVSTTFDMEPSDIARIRETSALVILKIDSSSYMIPISKPGTTVMAFTTPQRLVYVIRDRFDDQQQLEEVVRHELSHALGAGHSIRCDVLMSVIFNRDYEQCVDYDAIEKVAKAWRLPVNRLNYCSYE